MNRCKLSILVMIAPVVCLGSGLIGSAPAQAAEELLRQLQTPINNGTQSRSRNEADRLMRQGSQQQAAGELEKAIASWKQAMRIYHNIGEPVAVGLAYDFIGVSYGELGDFVAAENALRRRLGVARDHQDFRGQIFGLNNVGTVLLHKHELDAAETTFEEALEMARSINSLEGEGLSLSNLGLVAFGRGDFHQAIKRYEAALTLRRQVQDPTGEANTLNNLGDAYWRLAQYPAAIANYGQALRLAAQVRDRRNEMRAIDGLVVAHNAVERYERSLDLLDRRLQIAQEQNNLREQFISLRTASQVYQRAGKLAQAKNSLEQALPLARTLGEWSEVNRIQTDLYHLQRAIAARGI